MKRYWNGSAWTDSNVYWVNHSSESQWSYGIRSQIKITAELTDLTTTSISVYGYLSDTRGDGILSGTRSIKRAGSSFISLYNDHREETKTTTIETSVTFSYSGDVSVSGPGGAGQPSRISGSSTVTNPFATITFNDNGGSGGPETQIVFKDISNELASTEPTRANHTFLGWSTSSSAHTADYSAGGNITVSADTALYAVWQPCVFISADEGVTITFDGVSYTDTTATVGKTWGAEYALTTVANAGFIIKTQSHADGNVEIDADEITISATSQRVGCHIDDGDDFVQAVMYVDNGVSYDMVQAYVDNGVSWELVY